MCSLLSVYIYTVLFMHPCTRARTHTCIYVFPKPFGSKLQTPWHFTTRYFCIYLLRTRTFYITKIPFSHPRKVMLIQYYKLIYSLHSDSPKCSKDVLYRFFFFSVWEPIKDHSLHLVSLVSFNLGQSPHHFVFHDNDIFEKFRPVVLKNVPQRMSSHSIMFKS